VSFDCAHAVGNVPLKLHEWGVDFACWCSYKYLNSGPGGIAGLFVHERWEDRRRCALAFASSPLGSSGACAELTAPARARRLHGWWGHDKATRFAMPANYSPLPGAAGWQFSNPSVLDVVSLLSSLRLFQEAGQVPTRALAGGQAHGQPSPILGSLREKSVDLTGYLELLLMSSPFYRPVSAFPPPSSTTSPAFTIITPLDPARRGAQLSLLFHPVESMDWIFERLRERGVLGDERRPGVIRFAPVPMYNSWRDVHEAAQALEESMRALVVWVGQGGQLDEVEQRDPDAAARERTAAAEDEGLKQ